MKQTKRRFEPYTYFNPVGISRHLEKQAAEGWMLERITNRGWYYRRMEPKKLTFTVTYCAQASEFDPEPTEGLLRFQEFCAHTGWNFVCASAQLQIFCNERENPTPIWTEPELELEAVRAAAKKTYLPVFFLYLFIGLMQGYMFLGNLLKNPIYLLSTPSQLFLGVCAVLMLILSLTELGVYFTWVRRAEREVEQGSLSLPPDTAWLQKLILAAVLLAGLYWAINIFLAGDTLMRWILIAFCFYMPLLYALVEGTKNFLKRKKASRGLNRTLTFGASFLFAFLIMGGITWFTIFGGAGGWFAGNEETYEHRGNTFVIHQDELPLTVEDLLEVDYDGYIKERRGSESLFLGQLTMRQWPRFDAEDFADIPRLEYTVTVVKMPWLYEFCKEELIKDGEDSDTNRRYQQEKAAPWGAEEAYRVYGEYGPRDRWLLCYENNLVEIDLEWEPTAEHKAIISEKLSG